MDEEDEGAKESVEIVVEEAIGSEPRLSESMELAVLFVLFEVAVSRTLTPLLSSASGLAGWVRSDGSCG